jgi:hypothetical protein
MPYYSVATTSPGGADNTCKSDEEDKFNALEASSEKRQTSPAMLSFCIEALFYST